MNNKLYVGNLPYSTDEAALRELFSKAGAIKSISIPVDRMTGQPRGFAFVEMESPNEALKAIKLCDGVEINGRAIKVNEAKPPENRSGSTNRSSGGGKSNYNKRW